MDELRRIRFPGPSFPAPTAMAVDAPERWRESPDPAGLLVLAGPPSPSGYHTNLLGTVHRLPPPVDLDSIVRDATEAKSRGIPVEASATTVGGNAALRVRQRFTVPEWDEEISSDRVLVAVPLDVGGLVDVVDVQITTPAAHRSAIADDIDSILGSLVVG